MRSKLFPLSSFQITEKFVRKQKEIGAVAEDVDDAEADVSAGEEEGDEDDYEWVVDSEVPANDSSAQPEPEKMEVDVEFEKNLLDLDDDESNSSTYNNQKIGSIEPIEEYEDDDDGLMIIL
jgi:hypothetical protein